MLSINVRANLSCRGICENETPSNFDCPCNKISMISICLTSLYIMYENSIILKFFSLTTLHLAFGTAVAPTIRWWNIFQHLELWFNQISKFCTRSHNIRVTSTAGLKFCWTYHTIFNQLKKLRNKKMRKVNKSEQVYCENT